MDKAREGSLYEGHFVKFSKAVNDWRLKSSFLFHWSRAKALELNKIQLNVQVFFFTLSDNILIQAHGRATLQV